MEVGELRPRPLAVSCGCPWCGVAQPWPAAPTGYFPQSAVSVTYLLWWAGCH